MCKKGVCTPNKPDPGQCTVCASGCAYTSVNAAFAAAADGATITIASGTWPTGISVTKDITLEACGSDTNVILTPDGALQAPDSYYAIVAEDAVDTVTPHTVTVRNLTLKGTGIGQGEALLDGSTNGTVSFIVEGCAFADADSAIYAAAGDHVISDSTFTGLGSGVYITMSAGSLDIAGCHFTGTDSYGVFFEGNTGADRADTTASMTDTVIEQCLDAVLFTGGLIDVAGCLITGNGSNAEDEFGGLGCSECTMTVSDTTISGNTDAVWGAGIYVYALIADASVTLGSGVSVTGNTAPEASGIGVSQKSPYTGTVIGASSANVHDNTTGDQCEITTDEQVTWTPAPNCAF